MKVGEKLEITKEVTEDYSAKALGSGGVDVLGTPALVAFMEETALKLVEPSLEEGEATVGITVDIKHLAPTPLGDKVKVEAVLDEIDGKKLKFSVSAYDSKNKIGEGKHDRFIINVSKFMEKLS